MNQSQQIMSDLYSSRMGEEIQPINEPAAVVQSFAQKSGKSVAEVEALWNKLKKQAEEKGFSGDRLFRYVVGTLKKILKIK